MSKVLKGAAIGALVFFTGGLALSVLPEFIGAAIGFTGFGAAAAAGAIYGGLMGLSATFTKKPSANLSTVQNRLNISVNPQERFKWVFGETALDTSVVYAESHGANKEYASYVIAAAGHTIYSFEDLYINDEFIPVSGSDWDGVVYWEGRLGTDPQAPISSWDAADQCSWPATSEGVGIAHYRIRFSVGQEKISSGIPTRITLIGKGIPVYDPRLDSTNGGSGTHRYNNQLTWQYTNGGVDIGANWALIVALYWLGWRIDGKLVFGVGDDPANIDWEQVAAMASVCDAIRDGIPSYRIGGMFTCDNDHEQVFSQLESATGGKIYRGGGKRSLWVPNNDLVPFSSIQESDILREGGVEFTPSAPLENLYNTARGRYISPDELYQLVNYPDVVESTAVSDDGRERLLSHDFSLIQDQAIAERVARYLIRRSRFTATWVIAMGPKGLIFKPFSVTTLNCQETNFEDVTVRVINMSYNLSGVVILELLEEDASIYDTSLPLGTPVTQLDPNSFDPATTVSVTNLAASTVTLTGSEGTASDAFEVTWDDPQRLVARTQVQYKISLSARWVSVPDTSVDFDDAVINAVEPGTLYDIRARHITVVGVYGPWESIQKTAGNDAVDAANAAIQNLINSNANALINPSFESGDVGWIRGENATIVSSDARLLSGSWSGKIDSPVTISFFGNDGGIECSPGDRILALGYAKKTSGTGQFYVNVLYLDDAGGFVGTVLGNPVSSSTYGQSRYIGVVPSGASEAKFYFYADGSDSDLVGHVDAAYMAIMPKDSDINIIDTVGVVTGSINDNEIADGEIAFTSGTTPGGGQSGDLLSQTYTPSTDAQVSVSWSATMEIDIHSNGTAPSNIYAYIVIIIDGVNTYIRTVDMERHTSSSDSQAVFGGNRKFNVPAGQEIEAKFAYYRVVSSMVSGVYPANTLYYEDVFLSIEGKLK